MVALLNIGCIAKHGAKDGCFFYISAPSPQKVTCIKFYFFLVLLVNLRKRTGDERRRKTLRDKRDNNFV